jgi:transcriptional regulator with XRE-family HTH domain
MDEQQVPEFDPIGFGRRLRSAMVLAGLRTSNLAEEIQVTQITVQRHMRGESLPDAAQITRYCSALGVSADYLLPRLDSNQQPAGVGIAAA